MSQQWLCPKSIQKIQYCFYFSELRLAVRGSLARKDRGSHEHDYGEESYDEEEDIYSKKCKTCGHIDTYEKM